MDAPPFLNACQGKSRVSVNQLMKPKSDGSSSEGAGRQVTVTQGDCHTGQQPGTDSCSAKITWTAEGRWERGIFLFGWGFFLFFFFPQRKILLAVSWQGREAGELRCKIRARKRPFTDFLNICL